LFVFLEASKTQKQVWINNLFATYNTRGYQISAYIYAISIANDEIKLNWFWYKL